jgi:hypothetical protein
MIKKVAVILSLIPALAYSIEIIRSPLPYQVIDRNENGIISLWELMNSGNVGKREIVANGTESIEYYWLKDGLTAHV